MASKKQTPLMNSNFDRREKDFYPTIDTRCLDGLLYYFTLPRIMRIVDVCADQGSALVDQLQGAGYSSASGVGDAYMDGATLQQEAGGKVDWIITNTPYELSVVDKIIMRQVERVQSREIVAAAFLLRSTFDHAARRRTMFDNPAYAGQIKLCFRPWWTESRDKSPFHSYAWQIFKLNDPMADPFALRYYAPYEKRYAADVHGFKCRACGANKKQGRIKYTSQDKVGACSVCGDPEYSLLEMKS